MNVIAICLAVAAVMAYVNHRFIRLPSTIGVMSIALVLSGVFVLLDHLGYGVFRDYEEPWLKSIDFSDVLMQGMLSVLLFAGALHVDLSELKTYRWQIATLAILGTSLSTILIGTALWYLLPIVGLGLPLAYCFAFGALISPTDPIAVMGILKSARAPKSLEIVISGESLFNDGVGVVLFVLVESMLTNGEAPTLLRGAELLLLEAGGGIAFGLVLGYVTFRLLRSIDSYQEEVLITLAAVVGGYALANRLHVSGPLAMVVVGLVIGNQGRALAMSDVTRKHLDMFWELLDAILNCVLFVLLGMEVLLIQFSFAALLPATLAIAVTLSARLLTASVPSLVFANVFKLPRGSWQVLTWGGLRGGISVALALSLPPAESRDIVLTLTYSVVVFSILIQGLTIKAVVERALSPGRPTA